MIMWVGVIDCVSELGVMGFKESRVMGSGVVIGVWVLGLSGKSDGNSFDGVHVHLL